MALKIRLRQQGRNNRPFYRVVVADARSPRDGKYVESLGWYNPFIAESDKGISLKTDRLQYWLDQGAQLTESVKALVFQTSPMIIRNETEKEVARRLKKRTKIKARKNAAV